MSAPPSTMPSTASTPASRATAKWGPIMGSDFTMVPNTLIKNYQRLGLNPTEFVVLLNLLEPWWYGDRRPFIRTTTVAERMATTVRTVQRSIQKLKKLDLVSTSEGPSPKDPSDMVTFYHFDGLIKALQNLPGRESQRSSASVLISEITLTSTWEASV